MIEDPTEIAACPFCSSPMRAVYVITSGGVWWCESKEYLEYCIAGAPPEEYERMRQVNREKPPHCVIGGSGYKVGKWPKRAMYCGDCGSITIQCKGP